MKRSWSWTIGAVISIAALTLVFWGVRLGDVWRSLQSGQYVYLAPATGMLVLGLLTRAKSWHTLLGRQVPYWKAFHSLNEGYLLNNVLPFRLGEIGRAYLVSRGQVLTGSQALSSVLVERLIDLTVSVSILLLSLPYAISASWATDAARASVVLAVVLYLGILATVYQKDRVLQIIRWVLDRMPAAFARIFSKRAESFLDGLASIKDGRRLLRATFWSAMAWGTYGVECWLVLKIFFPSPSLAAVAFLLGVTAISAAVPSSPGAVGVFEASAVAALLAFDYPRPAALSFAVTLHLSVLATTCLFGAFGLAREGESLLSVAHSARAYFRAARESSPVL